MFRFKWGRLLSGGILLTIIGIFITIQAIVHKPEEYKPLAELSYKRLSDNMLIRGNVSRIIGKYNYNFGGGRKTYFVTALPSTLDTDSIKYISIDPESSILVGDLYLQDHRVEKWTDCLDNGADLPDGEMSRIQCRLHKMSEDDMAAAYSACGDYVSQGDILPYYAEQYYINYKEQSANAPRYPIGVGIALLILGAGAVTVWILRPIITKNK